MLNPARSSPGRLRRGLTVLAALFALASCPAWRGMALAQSVPDSVTLEGNWFQRELTRLKSFPHLDKAYRLLAQGNRSEAVREFQSYLALVPGDTKVQELLAGLLAEEGRAEEALRQAEAVLAERPGLPRMRLIRANLLVRLGRDDEAAKDFEQALADGGQDRELALQAASGLAGIRLRQGRPAEALALLEALDKPVPVTSPVATLLRAQALVALGRPVEAQALLAKSLEAAATPQDKAEVLDLWAKALEDQGDLEGARERLLESLRTAPGRAAALRALAENAIRRKAPEEAVEYARQAEAAEASPAARELAANALLLAGRPREAAQLLEKMAAETAAQVERDRLTLRAANALALAGDDAAAAEAYARAAQSGREPGALEGLAAAFERLGRFQEAADALQKALDAFPSGERLLRLAGLRNKAGDPTAAARLVERALAGELAQEARAMALEELGLLQEEAGKNAEAAEAWKQALASRPGDPTLLARLAAVSQRMGDIRAALGYARAARDAKPDLETTSSLAVLTALSGQPGQAAELLRQALPMAQGRPEEQADILERLAVLEAMTGRHDLAAQDFVKAYDALPGKGSPELLAKAAGEWLAAGQDGQARAVLERLLRLPGLSREVRAQAQAREGALLLRQGDMARAAASLREALGSGALPRLMRLDALASLAALEQREGNADKAVELLEQAMREGMEPWRARLSMGLALFQAKRYAQALEQLQAAQRDRPGPRVSLAAARCYEALNKPGLAIRAMLEVMPRQSGLSEEEQREYFFALGNLYAQTQDERRAAEAYRQSLAYREVPAVTIRLARMERLLGRPEEALHLLRQAQAQAGMLPEQAQAPGSRPVETALADAPPSARAPKAAPGQQGAPAAAAPGARTEAPAEARSTGEAQRDPTASPASAPAREQASAAQDGVRPVRVMFQQSPSGDAVLLKGVPADARPAVALFDAPWRLVVDLPGEWTIETPGAAPPAGNIQRVRAARHPGKLRVVLDLAEKPGGRALESTPEGLVVRLSR
ncbi:Beta-barrel assembly-enhancing protease [Fundidesulfovibrio magnetotacticus]|uniref:Beta-barrel assembly-enhancing protease n=1 Tax=Fundidesulfovibrio magnetotacticus TaxID=2730080 RepID=A0A6V8LNK8_9BACT|nr:tetratricopeptide repeat protein [Fundidesulfovibrio magnetotacticus]GFK92580.1 Beta-barrel assembly-enhancing protease [Fundidesulfovibrio magnetotacticus]